MATGIDALSLVRELDARNVAPLKQRHRDAMLDLVLTWGTLDGVLAMLLATLVGKPLHEAADLIGKQSGSGKLSEMIRLLKPYEAAQPIVKSLKRHKKQYEKFSNPRNRIAHSRCLGYLTNYSDYVVFLVFERIGEEMAAEAVPLEEFERAKRWGEAFVAWITHILDRLDPVSE